MVSMWLLGVAAAGHDAEPQLEGRYVMRLHVSSRAKMPIIGWVRTRTVTSVLVDLRHLDAQRYEQRHQVCEIEILNKSGQANVTIPRAFVGAMPVKVYQVRLAEQSGGWSYRADLGQDYIGYDPTLTESVPERPRDAGVIDGDGDGNPGMTVQLRVPVLGMNELYVAQHGWLRASGTVVSPDRVEGALEVAALQQRTLKASNPIFSLSPRLEPVRGESWFTLVRSPNATCEALQVPRPG